MTISIHSLRGEGDVQVHIGEQLTHTFQSTPSVGRETGGEKKEEGGHKFQSTPSVGRETAKLYNGGKKYIYPEYNSDKIGLFVYPHKPKKELLGHNFHY